MGKFITAQLLDLGSGAEVMEILDDLKEAEYVLENFDLSIFEEYLGAHSDFYLESLKDQ